jgi:exo-beta-1,3-glucanase (GH17 family)
MSSPRDPFATPEPAQTNFQFNDTPGHSTADNLDSSAVTPPGPTHDSGQNLAAAGAPMSTAYHGLETSPPEPYQWQEKDTSGSGRRKWLMLGAAAALLALIGIGVGVGVAVSHNHNNNSNKASSSSSGSGSGSGSGSNTNGSVVPQTDPNDPSTFIKDSRLHQVFYGLAYTPVGTQLPNCGATLADVITDVQLLSQLTDTIRLYGADCNQSALVLEAIKQTKVNLNVYLANYNVPDDGGAAYSRQLALILDALKTYGSDHVLGVTVGNEFMLNYLGAFGGGSDPNSAIGNQGAALLISNITDTRNQLKALNLKNTPKVGNSDAGSYFNTLVLEAIDYGMSNVHPWFASTTIQDAAGWTYEFFEETNVQPAALLPNKPTMYIAETGWPACNATGASQTDGSSNASVANLQYFLDTFVCQSNTNKTGYFFFEFQDQLWQELQFGGVEGCWGLFTDNKTLKSVNIPTCS